MKKIRLAFLSILVLLFGGILSACTMGNIQVDFSESELIVSIGDSVDLEDYIKTEGVSAGDVQFKVEDSSVLTVSNKSVTAVKSGQCKIYAVFKGDIFDSINVVVKKRFSAPSVFSFNDEGVLSWNAVSEIAPGQTTPTLADSYRVEGEIVVYDDENPTEVVSRTEINETTQNTYWAFEQTGFYSVRVVTVGKGMFDDSDASILFEKAFGAMNEIALENFAWNSGVLSWVDDVNEDAQYQVIVDDVKIGEPQDETYIDLSEAFDALDARDHKVRLAVYDKNGEKMTQVCDILFVTKIEAPEVEYSYSAQEGGSISVGYVENATNIKVVAKNGEDEEVYTLDNIEGGTATTLQGLATGIYDVTVFAVTDLDWYYQSEVVEFGKVYKMPMVEFSGYEQETDGTDLTFNSTLTSQVNSKVKMFIGQRVNIFDGVIDSENDASFEITLSSDGRYEITTVQMPAAEENGIESVPVYAINSDASEIVYAYKLAKILAMSHSYQNDVSVLTFAKVTNATTYRLQALDNEEFVDVDESLYEVNIGDENVSITFTDKLENNLLPNNAGVIHLKIVVGQEENVPAIESSYSFNLTELGVAQAVARENTNKTFGWTAVSNAASYRLEIYEVTKAIYQAGSTNIDLTGLDKTDETSSTTQYSFADVGYYLVKVFAVSESGSLYLSASESYDSLVCVAEQLELENVKFGYDVANEKYYILADNVDNLDSFEILIDDVSVVDENKSAGATSKYFMPTNFAGVDGAAAEFEVKVIGKANDNTIYLDSEEVVFDIHRLSKVEYRNMIISDWSIVSNPSFVLSRPAQTLTVRAATGARGVKIWDVNNQTNVAGGENAQSATYNLDTISNVALAFKYYGNAQTGEIFNDTDGEIYLDGPVDQIEFNRLANLTDLKYQSGNLVFENANSAATNNYVLTIICKNANNEMSNISVKLESAKVTASAGGESAVLSTTKMWANEGSTITLSLDEVLELLENAENDTIRQTYEQGAKFGFVVYSNPRTDMTGSLSSFIGKLEEDANANVVIVERMAAPELEYSISGANITLSWDAVSTRNDVAAATQYQIFLNGEEYGEKVAYNVTSKQYALADFNLSTYYSFVVQAENPYYIGSNDSNAVKIYKLKSLSSLKLISDGDSDGKLEYQILASEQGFVDYVLVNNEENTDGKITIGSNNQVTLQVVGQKDIQSGTMFTSYIDSTSTNWTLTNMSTLKPADETISYANGVISWNAFATGVGLGTLEYVLMFNDGENVAVFTTTETSVDINANAELFETISGLDEGNVTITLYAHLKTYSVAAGGTIYFSNAITLANGDNKSNYYAYDDTLEIKKLTTPVFETVDFEYNNVLENAQFPDINVEFTGNYDATAQFGIYIGEDRIKTINITKANDKYTFTLVKNEYNNYVEAGETFKLRVVALSDVDIPSSFGEVQITRAPEAESVTFTEGDVGNTQTLVITYNEGDGEFVAGGLVAKIVYTENGGSETTSYVSIPVGTTADEIEYDLTNFIATNLAAGGTIQVGVLANSYADDASEVYYLACPTYTESAEFEVLNSVVQADITISAGGFEIDKTTNSEDTIYILKCLDKNYEVEYDDGKFFFELDDSWANGNYDIQVYAVEDGYVRSKTSTVSITLNRISRISGVSIERDSTDLSLVTMSWTEIPGANGYIVKLYDASDDRVLYKTEVSSHTNTTTAIFGANYSRVFAYGEILAIPSDLNVKIGITTIGTSASVNNSNEYVFNAKINGRVLVVQDFDVDEHGLVQVQVTSGEKYLYRFVTNLGAPIAVSSWTMETASSDTLLIDASFLKEELVSAGEQFNLEIVRMGNITAQSTDVNFVLDSQAFTTLGTTITFEIHSEIDSIGYVEGATDELLFALTEGTFDKLFVGLTEDALINGEVEEIVPEYAFAKDATTAYYGYGFEKFIDLVKDNFNLSSGENTLYFWSHREVEDSEATYINSPVKSFTFNLGNTSDFLRVEKYINDQTDREDLENVFAIFANNDTENLTTIGLLVRIFKEAEGDDEEDIEEVRFVLKDVLTNQEYYGVDTFAINLTDIFEEEELIDCVGTFVVDFARVQIDNEENYIISQWLSQEMGEEIEFTRLEGVNNISLANGMLSWIKNDESADKFYIYFAREISEDFKIQNDYRLCQTSNNFFYANDEVGEDVAFFLAVRSVSENPYILPSKLIFIMGEENKAATIYKNKVTSPLVVRDGKMYFDWSATDDFVTFLEALKNDPPSTEGINSLLVKTFHAPFSFSIKGLVDKEITLRLRFTNLDRPGAIVESYDIQAQDLLRSLFDFDSTYRTQFDNYRRSVSASDEPNRILIGFIDMMDKCGNGIGNENNLFDKFFERLQKGKYKLEYQILGNDTTLTSQWYQFENSNGDNIVYVSEQPIVKALKEETESEAVNHYKLLIKKSEIFDETYVGKKAETYVIVLRDAKGEVSTLLLMRGVGSYSLALQGSENPQSVSVYETNAAGVVTANGDYLMFYLNHNNGDSVLGVYELEIEKGSYEMQIYAVGNDCALSSKSEYFVLMFHSMGENMQMVNGKFTWTAQRNADTTIVYKKLASPAEDKQVIKGKAGDTAELEFDLDDAGGGEFEYLEFVTVGKVGGNTIFVDSEIYKIYNVYKLVAPSLSNNAGYLTIKENNKEKIDASYSDSDSPLYTYKIYNNESTETTYVTRTDENRGAGNFLYEAGITFVKDDDERRRKEDEATAQKFFVKTLGTTASFVFVQESADYYLKTVYCLDDTTGLRTNKNVVVSSRYAEFNAEMMDAPTGLEIENGNLVWEAVEGKGSLVISARHKVVYKLTIEQYNNSATDGLSNPNTQQTTAGETRYFYTTKTEFDFANILEEEANCYAVTIQALAMIVTKTAPSNVSPDSLITLMDGEGFGYGNVKYYNTNTFVLMSEGTRFDEVERTKSIENLHTDSGHLVWEFVPDKDQEVTASYNLFENYEFFVQDENKKELEGEFECELLDIETRTYSVSFVESKGQIAPGRQTLSVFATKLVTRNNVIKSYGVDIEITKLPEVKESNITISSTTDTAIETFTLAKYFEENNGLLFDVDIISNLLDSSDNNMVFTMGKNLLYILSANREIDLSNAVGKVLITNDSLTITLQVKPTSSFVTNVLYSDLSDDIVLQRSAWEGNISWDSTDQKFVWEYDGYYALQENVNAKLVEYATIETIDANAEIFEDDALTTPADVELGNDYVIVEVYEEFVQIQIDGEDYFVSIDDYSREVDEENLVEVEDAVLPTGTLYKVKDVGETKTIIELEPNEDEEVLMYAIANNKVVGPTYIVSITCESNTRIYTTQNQYFVPTVIGTISRFSVRIKLGPTNIQSDEYTYDGEVAFNLFSAGNGTMMNPYEISSEQEFLNIAKRMRKMREGEHLNEYIMNGTQYIEEEKFFFKLLSDITVDEAFEGILFAGEFNGEINGQNHTVTYTSSNVTALQNPVSIAGGYISNSTVEFQYGTALFEKFAATAKIYNLNIDASFHKATDRATISRHSLIAGLVITNNGQIDNVCVTGFDSDFVGQYSSSMVDMLYSGLVAVNIGGDALVINCGNTADMRISNFGKAQVDCVSGLVTLNYATIEDCTCGTEQEQNTLIIYGNGSDVDAYVSGIATINAPNATIRGCTNYAEITVSATDGDKWHAYLDEICTKNSGTMQDNASPNYVVKTAAELGVNSLVQGPNYSA